MPLFSVEHDLFSMWVVAPSYATALEAWRKRALELLRPPFEFEASENPESITLIANDDELAIYHDDETQSLTPARRLPPLRSIYPILIAVAAGLIIQVLYG